MTTELEDWDAKFWEGRNDLCLGCMPRYMVAELWRQELERRELAKRFPTGPIG